MESYVRFVEYRPWVNNKKWYFYILENGNEKSLIDFRADLDIIKNQQSLSLYENVKIPRVVVDYLINTENNEDYAEKHTILHGNMNWTEKINAYIQKKSVDKMFRKFNGAPYVWEKYFQSSMDILPKSFVPIKFERIDMDIDDVFNFFDYSYNYKDNETIYIQYNGNEAVLSEFYNKFDFTNLFMDLSSPTSNVPTDVRCICGLFSFQKFLEDECTINRAEYVHRAIKDKKIARFFVL